MRKAWWIPSIKKPITKQFDIAPFRTSAWNKTLHAPQIMAEKAIEAARPSNLPSRDGSIFLCPSLKACDAYAEDRPGAPAFEVEYTGQVFATFGSIFGDAVRRAQDFIYATRRAGEVSDYRDQEHFEKKAKSALEEMDRIAGDYWKAKLTGYDAPRPELLVRGIARVVRQVRPVERELRERTNAMPRGVLVESQVLAERRGNWLFHTTSPNHLAEILADGILRGSPYVSFSDTANWSGVVTLVFSRERLLGRVMKVEYTEEWFLGHPLHAHYIAGEDDTERVLSTFRRRAHEREWVSVKEDVKLRPGDIDRIIVKPNRFGLRRKPQIDAAVEASSLVGNDDLMWRDIPKHGRWSPAKTRASIAQADAWGKAALARQAKIKRDLEQERIKLTVGASKPAFESYLIERTPVTFDSLDDLKDAITKREAFLKKRHRFIRFGQFGKQSRVALPADLMADIAGGMYDAHAGEGGARPVRYEQGVSAYFARKQGGGWTPESPDSTKASYGLSDYWGKMSKFFKEAICAGEVFLVEGSLIREMEFVPVELAWGPEREHDEWMRKWDEKDLARRKSAGLGLTLGQRARPTWGNLARKLGAISEKRGAWVTYYFPSAAVKDEMQGLIDQHGPVGERQVPRSVRATINRRPRRIPPGAPKIEDVPELLPTYASGADGEPVIENVKVIARLDPFGDGGKPRLFLPFRLSKRACAGVAESRVDESQQRGDCYEAAVNYLMEHGTMGFNAENDAGLILVHGEVTGQGPLEGVKYGHAWIESGGLVIDTSNGRDLRMPASAYYALAQIDHRKPNVHKYTQEQARRKLIESGHYGAWDLKTESGL